MLGRRDQWERSARRQTWTGLENNEAGIALARSRHGDGKDPEVSSEGSSAARGGEVKAQVPLRESPGRSRREAVRAWTRQAPLNFPKNKNKSVRWCPARGCSRCQIKTPSPLHPPRPSPPRLPPPLLLLLLMSNQFTYRLPPRSASLTGPHQPASSWCDGRGIQYRAEPWKADLKTSFGK